MSAISSPLRRSPEALACRVAWPLAVAVWALAGCGADIERPGFQIDCAADDAYETQPVFNIAADTEPPLFPVTDGTGGRTMPFELIDLEDAFAFNLTPVRAFYNADGTVAQNIYGQFAPEERQLSEAEWAIEWEQFSEAEREDPEAHGFIFLDSNGKRVTGQTKVTNTIDDPPKAVMELAVEPLAEPRCGADDTHALVIRASGNTDWGGFIGDYGIVNGVDASDYAGVSFWARAAVGTTQSFTVRLDDATTANLPPVALSSDVETTEQLLDVDPPEDDPNDPTDYFLSCEPPPQDAAELGGSAVEISAGTSDVAIGSSITGRVPREGECGNQFRRVVSVSERWEFYTLPFEEFAQDPYPNRSPGGIDSSSIRGFQLGFPKEAVVELYLDEVNFYRALSR